MTVLGWVQILFFFAVVAALTPPLGAYLHRILEDRDPPPAGPLAWLERLVCRAGGADGKEQTWQGYARALLAFSAFSTAAVYAIQRLQHRLPLNPQHLGPVEAASAFNTAVSFATNTNWQGYAGEATMSYLTQMAALAWQNFVSAAAGIAVAMAVARGLTRRGSASGTVGNFWNDLVRVTVHVLLPISLIVALFLVSQGAIQTLAPYRTITTLEGTTQTLALGPVASQEAIKQLGTNGGGFFNANAAHPFENPNPLTNFLSLILIFAIPAALTFTFGRMAGDQRQGWVLFGAMVVLCLAGLTAAYWAESADVGAIGASGAGFGNLEGKEVRFGVPASVLYAVVTTDASCGAVNALHDSFTPLGGLVLLLDMQLGEVVFGGVGSGLYGILVMAILSVFIAGLMVGRTPEYLGKKIEAREVKLAMFYVLVFPLVTLALSAWSSVSPAGRSSLGMAGPHGLSQILYAFTSATANNGSAFGGLAANTAWYNLTLALAMWVGRFFMIVPALAMAGSLARKSPSAPGPGTLPTGGPLFAFLLVCVIVVLGALTFFPALSLGPLLEHFLAAAGRRF